MKIFIGFDDTDNISSEYGTGKLTRWFQKLLPEGVECLGVVRQQLLVSDEIPYTSHNSAACMIVNADAGNGIMASLAESAAGHIARHAADGSDPGLCLVKEEDSALEDLKVFGKYCTSRAMSQQEAIKAAKGVYLEGLGGTNDGLIGAAAAVGLTASGWSGRFIEYGDLRRYEETVTVAELTRRGIEVISTDRDAKVPAPDDRVLTNKWLRPRLLGNRPVVIVAPDADDSGLWINIYKKRNKRNGHQSK